MTAAEHCPFCGSHNVEVRDPDEVVPVRGPKRRDRTDYLSCGDCGKSALIKREPDRKPDEESPEVEA